jgi:hypothetical protein
MSIIGLILVLILAGVVLSYVPMDGRIKTIIIVVLALVTVGWLLSYFGLWGYLQSGPHQALH